MKTRKILIITTIMCLIGFATACKDDALSNNNPIEEQPRENLVGTKWRLVGFFDIETGKLTEALPEENPFAPALHTLEFTNDTVGFGRVLVLPIHLFLLSNNLSPVFRCYSFERTDTRHLYQSNESADLFYEAIETSTHYVATQDELKIYYVDKQDNDRKKYLLYSCRGTDTVDTDWMPKETIEISSENLIGTKWKLKSFVDEENNIGRCPYPRWIGPKSFTFSFTNDITSDSLNGITRYSVTGVTSNNDLEGTYWIDYNTNTLNIIAGLTKKSELGSDGEFYFKTFIGENCFPFKLYQNELRLYYTSYSGIRYYLLYERR